MTVFATYGLEGLRRKRDRGELAKQVARAIASEVHSHKWTLTQVLEGKRQLAEIPYLPEVQWQASQRELWGLNPVLGVMFRRYYDALGELKSTQFTMGADLEVAFAPILGLADECLRTSDFPLRFGSASISTVVSISATGTKTGESEDPTAT